MVAVASHCSPLNFAETARVHQRDWENAAVDERALGELRRLADEDRVLSDRANEVRRLDGEIGAIRSRAEAIDASLDALPEQEARDRAELEAAGEAVEARLRQQAEAEQVIAAARDDDARADAERARSRAADHVAVARARADRAAAAVADVRRDAERLPKEAAELNERAAALAGVERPRGDSSLVDWAAHAHAELLVEASQLDAQRERLIREANELATMLVGEPTYGATAAQALARARAHCESEPGQVSDSR
jgi:chromosome segregation ATPase